jgi:hypothetical protein
MKPLAKASINVTDNDFGLITFYYANNIERAELDFGSVHFKNPRNGHSFILDIEKSMRSSKTVCAKFCDIKDTIQSGVFVGESYFDLTVADLASENIEVTVYCGDANTSEIPIQITLEVYIEEQVVILNVIPEHEILNHQQRSVFLKQVSNGA